MELDTIYKWNKIVVKVDFNNKSIIAKITPKNTVDRRDVITPDEMERNLHSTATEALENFTNYNNNDEEKCGAEQISRTQYGRAVINFAFLCQGSSTPVMY